ncbi:hypothetical protein FFF34_003905 [Inquilinus sp. KBS0705]|nr:hypothetical protein FFF34_003905 [Inquilinus sp. KBS0705]
MVKNKLLIATIILFLLLNTAYYWEGLLSFLLIPATLLMALCYVVIIIYLLGELFRLIRGRFKDRIRLYQTGVIIVLMILIGIRPLGIINFDKLEGKDLFIADREGAANCTITLKLKANSKFYINSVCFGVDKYWGTYQIVKDTIKFNFRTTNENSFKYAVFKPAKSSKDVSYVTLYRLKNDKLPLALAVEKNDLFK